MNKNMFKRTWLNITRKRSKSAIMFIIMFVIANLVLATLAISNSVDESTQYAKDSLGSTVYLNPNMEGVKENIAQGGVDKNDPNFMAGMRPEITLSMVEELGGSEYVNDYKYSTTVIADAVDFNYLEQESIGRPTMKNQTTITGINSYAFIPEVESNIIEITEGTYFDESTDGAVIISYELAQYNELAVGDKITFSNPESNQEYQYNIIGIFLASQEGLENNVYMNVTSIEKLMSTNIYNDGDYIVDSPVYYLNNPEDSEAFIEAAYLKYDFDSNNLTLDIDSNTYQQMVGPIESVGSFSSIMLLVVVIAAVSIITLIINNNVKDRKYEIGVLMSLGATKLNIIIQIFLELVFVASIAFVLSIGTSTIVANTLSDNLLSNQIEMSQQQSDENFGRPNGGMNPSMDKQMIGIQTNQVEVIDEINVSIEVGEYLILFALGYLITFIAMIGPASRILRYEPKTILTGRD